MDNYLAIFKIFVVNAGIMENMSLSIVFFSEEAAYSL